MNDMLQKLMLAMIDFDAGQPDLIQHFTKVHAYACLIASGEGMPEPERIILEAAALVHDIAIPLCYEKYGNCAGPHQEAEGPALVRNMLPPLGFTEAQVERICWLVAHHHTFDPVTESDHRILLEADWLVNAFESEYSKETKQAALKTVFHTKTGTQIYRSMFAKELK